MTPSSQPRFGDVLRRLRLEADLSQETLAERARVSKQAVSALERGARQAPQAQTLALLVNALGLDAAQRAELEAAARASMPARVRRKPVQPAVTQRGSMLPVIATSFVGRAAERSKLEALLQPGWCITVWGSGGIGKTRLALETARTVERRFPDGVWFVEIDEVVDEADVAQAIATTAGIAQRADRPLLETLIDAFRDQRALVFLDNAEHVIDAVARIVERLLQQAPSLTILCTSREPLRIAAEHVYELGSLPVPRLDDPELEQSPAVRLFMDRAASVGSRVELKRELRSVATICDQLDAVPLALELAAARSPLMTPAEIARDLADDRPDRLRLLSQGSRTARPRHQTLTGVLDWSVARLSDVERLVLARLSVWPGRWTLDDAVAVACDTTLERWSALDAVNGLVSRSLVIVSESLGDTRAYRMLQTTRTYALERANTLGELSRCRRLQAGRVRDHLAQENANLSEATFTQPSGVDLSSVRAALRWAISQANDVVTGAAIAISAERLWAAHGAQLEALEWLREACDELPPYSASRFDALLGIAKLARDMMQYSEAYEAASNAVALADAADGENATMRGQARLWLGLSASVTENKARGRQLLEEALALFESAGNAPLRLKVLHELSGLAMLDGRFADARMYALPLPDGFRAQGLTVWSVSAEINLAEIEFGLGNTSEAIRRGRSALDAMRALHSPVNLAIATHNLAGYYNAAGDIEKAIRYGRESLEIAYDYGWQTHCANAIGQLATALAAIGDLHEAALLTGFLEERLRAIGFDYRMELELESHRHLRERLEAAFAPEELEQALRTGAGLDAEEAAQLALEATSDSPERATG
jgi:predicted ATPase/DNA-binding XRE family transcriptional regulator